MIHTIAQQLKGYRLPSLLTPLCMVGEVLCEMVIPILMGLLVDRGIYGGQLDYVLQTGGMMLLVALVGFGFGLAGAFTASRASTGLAMNLRKAMFDNIQTFSFASIDKFSTSSLVTRMTTDVTNVQNAYQMLLRMAMRAPSMMVVAMMMSFAISPRLASIYLVAVLFLTGFLLLIMKSAGKYFRQVFQQYDALNESVQENVSAIRVVKAYVREDYSINRFQKAAANIYLVFVKAERKVIVAMPMMNATVYLCILLISWIGAHMIVSQTLTTGELMSLLTYCMNILSSLMFIAMIFVMVTMSEASCRRIAEVINEETQLTNPPHPIQEVADGSISFDHVSFAYHSGAATPVLRDVSVSIGSGETVGILGGTGSAKSSMVNLISRLYDVTEGRVLVGGRDVREYDLTALRNQVAVVLQNNVLFSGTLYDNLRWGDPDASDEACQEAARIACADAFIRQMPEGYETRIEQGGTNVSGGQKQRICIARALLKKPKILIFDDSTSAVDTATDARIRAGLRQFMPQTTKLIIAQRISSVQDCDRILVLDDGAINGIGTHEELLATNAIYREVYESQKGAYDDADFDPKN